MKVRMNRQVSELNSKLPKIIKNTDEKQIYDLAGGKIRVIKGYVVCSPSHVDYTKIFSSSDIAQMLGVSNWLDTRISISIMNGDGVAYVGNFYSPMIYNHEIWIYNYPSGSGRKRYDYRIEYVYPD